MAFFKDQPGADVVEKLLLKAAADQHQFLLCAVNWGEIYYSVMRAESQEIAEQKAKEIAGLPIEIVPVGEDLELVRQAATYKATKKMSYADCFAAALAKLRKAPLVTGDTDFKEVENEIKVEWLP